MATNLQIIQCPRCGSTQTTEIRPGYFHCNSCGTEYFLDTGNGVPPIVPSPPASPGQFVKKKIGIGLLAAVIIFFVIYSLTTHSSSETGSTSSPSPTSDDNTGGGHHPGARQSGDITECKESYLFQANNGDPVLLVVGDKILGGYAGDHIVSIMFIDIAQDIQLKSYPLPGATYNDNNSYAIQEFSNGDLYIVFNHTTLYRVDKSSYSVKDVSKSLFEDQKDLAAGVDQLDFINDHIEDGFEVVTHDSKTFFYFPLVGNLYTQDSLYRAQTGFGSLLPGSTEKTAFVFGYKVPNGGTGDPDLKQLETYRYMYNKGGPALEPIFDWRADDPQQKDLIRKESIRVLSYAELTPGKVYYKPELLYYDKDYVLIHFEASAAATAKSFLQCLHARTGAIVFSVETQGGVLRKALRYKDWFAVNDMTTTNIVNMKGELVKSIKYDGYGF